ncbi:MAG: LamG-like jellyroll fold domain-containing protein [Candidatus Bathyarchaeia archaeon]
MSKPNSTLCGEKTRYSALLVFTLLVLLTHPIYNVVGSAFSSLAMQTRTTVNPPSVTLETGTAGTTTIYTNKTSARVSVAAENDTLDHVDNNTSNVDSSNGKGTHSNFTAQQSGPDSICDKLKEGNTSVAVNNWGITSSSFTLNSTHTNYRYMSGISPDVGNMKVKKLHIRYSGAGTVAIALYTGGILTDPTGATKRTEAYNVAVSAGWNEIDVPDYDWGRNTVTWIGWCRGGAGIYYSSSSADAGDFQSARGRWDQTTPADANETISMPVNPGAGSFANYWYAMYVEYEIPTYELDLEAQWTSADYDETNEELFIHVNKGGNTHSLDATGGYMTVGSGTPNWGSSTGTISFWVKWNTLGNRPWGQHENMETRFSGSNLVIDWGAAGSLTSTTSFITNKWYFIAIVWNESTDDLYLYLGDQSNSPTQDAFSGTWTLTVSTVGVTQNNFMASKGGVNPTDGHGEDLRYWNTERSLAQLQSDYESELTGSETNLRSYFKLNNNFDDIGANNNDGSGSGSYSFSSDVPFEAPPSENIRVDAWNGTAWQNLFTDLSDGWNNVSVSSYLASSTFTIRFKGNSEASDTAQDSWKIDATFLHVWTFFQTTTYDYVLRVNNTVASSWQVRLSKYSESSISRLQNCTIYFHNSTDGTSIQIQIENGAYTQRYGSWYDLPSSATIYVAVTAEADDTGTSHVYAYFETLTPGTTTYTRYVVTFEVT